MRARSHNKTKENSETQVKMSPLGIFCMPRPVPINYHIRLSFCPQPTAAVMSCIFLGIRESLRERKRDLGSRGTVKNSKVLWEIAKRLSNKHRATYFGVATNDPQVKRCKFPAWKFQAGQRKKNRSKKKHVTSGMWLQTRGLARLSGSIT